MPVSADANSILLYFCSGTHRTLVFVNSVAAAEGVAALLAGIEMEDGGESLQVLQYHRGEQLAATMSFLLSCFSSA